MMQASLEGLSNSDHFSYIEVSIHRKAAPRTDSHPLFGSFQYHALILIAHQLQAVGLGPRALNAETHTVSNTFLVSFHSDRFQMEPVGSLRKCLGCILRWGPQLFFFCCYTAF